MDYQHRKSDENVFIADTAVVVGDVTLEKELRKIIQQLEDLDYQYKIGLIDLNIGLDAIICAI